MPNTTMGPDRHNYIHGLWTKKEVEHRHYLTQQRNEERLLFTAAVIAIFRDLKHKKDNGFFEGDIFEHMAAKLQNEERTVTKNSVVGIIDRARAEEGNEDL